MAIRGLRVQARAYITGSLNTVCPQAPPGYSEGVFAKANTFGIVRVLDELVFPFEVNCQFLEHRLSQVLLFLVDVGLREVFEAFRD